MSGPSLVEHVAHSLIVPLGYDPECDWNGLFAGIRGDGTSSLADVCRRLAVTAINAYRQPGTQPADMAPHEEVECALALFRALKQVKGEWRAVKVESPAFWNVVTPRTQDALEDALRTDGETA